MTNSWTDIKNADLVWIMGGNAAEAHPCGFKWVTEAKAERGAKLMVVDPRFNRSAAMADHYAPIRSGSDITFLSAVINYLLTNDKIHKEYVRNYTNAAFIVRDDFEFNEGLFSGYDEAKRTYDRSTWEYKFGPDGFAIRDMTLQDPRCVFQLMKKHFAQYTPELVERVCGTPKDKFQKVADWVSSTANGERAMTIMYALGWTQHTHGAQNIRCAAMIQLLCGNIGIPGGGVNALRGHSNVQGITDVGTLTAAIPGYLALPLESEPTLESHLAKRAFKPLTPNQTSYWQNYRKFYVSFLKSQFGANATKENEFGYNYLPKLDGIYDCIKMFDLMHQGKTNGLLCQGFNPLMAIPNSNKSREGLSKLKFLVSMDPIETDTARFWENHGEFNNVDPAKIQTEVFMLPVSMWCEEDGSVTNSSRCIQWKWKAADPHYESKTDIEVMADLFMRIRKLYEKDGGKGKEALLAVDWSYKDALHPTPEELLTELNGKALVDLKDADGKVVRAAGQRLASFGEMRDDGSTDGCMWIYTGVYGPAGNLAQRRDNSDPSGLGVFGNWGFSWPANRRIQYNRASADPSGKPERRALDRTGCAGLRADHPAGAGNRSVHHERRGCFASLGSWPDGRRSVPGSHGAVRVTDGQPGFPETQGQSGRSRVQERYGGLWFVQGLPDRRDHLSVDRALPLLDQDSPCERRLAAGVLRGNVGSPRQGKRHQKRTDGPRLVQPRRSEGQGRRDQTHGSVQDRRKDRAPGRIAAELRLHR